MMNRLLLAKVLFPMPVPKPFDYVVPADMEIAPGAYVLAPLAKRMAIGVVWAVDEQPSGASPHALKPIERVFATRPMCQEQRKFIDFVGTYSCAGAGRVLRMSLPNLDALEPSPRRILLKATGKTDMKVTPARAQVLEVMGEKNWPISALAKAANVSAAVVQGLVKTGALARKTQPVDTPFCLPDPDRKGLALTDLQTEAAGSLRQAVRRAKFAPILLDGVTGSGKTEVYFEAVAEALRQNEQGQVLILLPEIALTQDILGRFEQRFGAKPAEWHSDVTGAKRRRVWRHVAAGQARIVVGARSALFLPFADLSLIVVDEEHDTSFKQEEGVLYHARDMAVARAHTGDCPIVLSSATPSLESLQNVRIGRYGYLALPARPGCARLPDISTIDLKEHPPQKGRWISGPLHQAMIQTLERGEQVLLYLNRRGYAPLTICRACGEKIKAPHTDSYLVEHRFSGRLVCHLTGYSRPKPDACPSCAAPGSLHPIGPGVERLADEVATLFPQKRCEVFSSDTTKTPQEIRTLIAQMEQGAIDILIGTQMAAKGHNFPKLTLVGVVDADMGLGGADLRAGERTYQTLIQVAGRAGRAELPGRAMLQTHQPEHEAIAALLVNDRERFVSAELELREQMGFPPFGRLAGIIISDISANGAQNAAQAFAALAPAAPMAAGIEIWGPSEPVFAMVRGRFRRRILVRSAKQTDLSAYMRDWRANFKPKGGVRIKLDIDPYSFL